MQSRERFAAGGGAAPAGGTPAAQPLLSALEEGEQPFLRIIAQGGGGRNDESTVLTHTKRICALGQKVAINEEPIPAVTPRCSFKKGHIVTVWFDAEPYVFLAKVVNVLDAGTAGTVASALFNPGAAAEHVKVRWLSPRGVPEEDTGVWVSAVRLQQQSKGGFPKLAVAKWVMHKRSNAAHDYRNGAEGGGAEHVAIISTKNIGPRVELNKGKTEGDYQVQALSNITEKEIFASLMIAAATENFEKPQ